MHRDSQYGYRCAASGSIRYLSNSTNGVPDGDTQLGQALGWMSPSIVLVDFERGSALDGGPSADTQLGLALGWMSPSTGNLGEMGGRDRDQRWARCGLVSERRCQVVDQGSARAHRDVQGCSAARTTTRWTVGLPAWNGTCTEESGATGTKPVSASKIALIGSAAGVAGNASKEATKISRQRQPVRRVDPQPVQNWRSVG